MHKPLIIANWKSNKSVVAARAWVEQFDAAVVSDSLRVAVAPPFTLLPVMSELLATSPLELAAQTVSPFPMGSYTGAIAAEQLVEFGVAVVILGHSERRRYFHEQADDVAKMVEQVLQAGMQPVVCLDEPDIDEQARALDPAVFDRCVFAYEPAGAIGTGNNQSVDEVVRVKQRIQEVFGQVPVIYGGSVNEQNIAEYLLVSDGALVATASLDPASFSRLLDIISS